MSQFTGTYKELMVTSQQLVKLRSNSIIAGLMDKNRVAHWRTVNAEAIAEATKFFTKLSADFAQKDETGNPVRNVENGVFKGWFFDSDELKNAYQHALDAFFNKEITIYL